MNVLVFKMGMEKTDPGDSRRKRQHDFSWTCKQVGTINITLNQHLSKKKAPLFVTCVIFATPESVLKRREKRHGFVRCIKRQGCNASRSFSHKAMRWLSIEDNGHLQKPVEECG